MIYPDTYITDALAWVRDFVIANPITSAALTSGIVWLSKKYPWIGKLIERIKAMTWRKPAE